MFKTHNMDKDMKISIARQMGAIMMIMSFVVGAGILALPITAAQLGLPASVLIMLVTWGIMTSGSLFVADLCIKMPKGASFSSLADKAFGKVGVALCTVVYLVIYYAICVAYISAAISSFDYMFPKVMSSNLWAIAFVLPFALFIISGTRSSDWLNRLLFVVKFSLLFFVCFVLMAHVDIRNLISPIDQHSVIFVAAPVILLAFSSQGIVPVITDYLGRDPKVTYRSIIIGCSLPFALYLLWLITVLGVLPLHGEVSFMSNIFNHKTIMSANIGDLLSALNSKLHEQTWLSTVISAFSLFSVMTSFLANALSLYHFNIDFYKLRNHSAFSRITIASSATFLIPLAIIFINPNLLVPALSIVGVLGMLLFVVMPTIILFIFEQRLGQHHYTISRSKGFRIILILLTLALVVMSLAQLV